MLLRKATLLDTEEMMELINHQAGLGLMLPRSRNMLYENIREFVLVEEAGKIVGVGGLHIMWHDLAEIRALAIAPEYQRQGLGRKIVEALIDEAQQLKCINVFVLTYQPDFFKKLGFEIVEKEKMPTKVWKECINCVKFPNCDEVPLMRSVEKKEVL